MGVDRIVCSKIVPVSELRAEFYDFPKRYTNIDVFKEVLVHSDIERVMK